MFNLELLKRHELTADDTDEGRFYDTPIGRLPSVTNVIDKLKNKNALKNWRKRIGDAKANEIVTQSRNYGNAIHGLAERYLLNEEDWVSGEARLNVKNFEKIKQLLDKNVTTIYGIELPLFSVSLRTAGRTDAVVKWAGYNSVLDFKTSKRLVDVKSEKIMMYKLQTIVYALMLKEQYGMNIERCIILVLTPQEPILVIPVFPDDLYYRIVSEIFNKR